MSRPDATEEPSVPARYYVSLPRLMTAQGIDPVEVLRAADISMSRLADAKARLSLAELERLVGVIVTIGGHPELALDVGKSVRLRDHSLVGYAILSSPTIDYALRLATRFFRLIFPAFRMRYRVTADKVELRLFPTMAMSPDCLAFHIEFVSVAVHASVAELVPGGLPACDLSTSLPEPPHCAHYARVMPDTRIHFGMLKQPGVRLSFPSSILAGQPAMANPDALALAERRCRELLEQMVASRSIGAWTRMMLRESNEGLPRVEELAATLNIGKRALHRHLEREGLVYRSLCLEERLRRGRELLVESRLSVTRIAQELGYSDASNFTRAFRAATGMSPSRYRAQSADRDEVAET